MTRKYLFLIIMCLVIAASLMTIVKAQTEEQTTSASYALIGAGLAIGLAGLGAGLGMGTASAAAIGAIAEKPEVFSKTLIFIVFIEAIAIYGLVVAFMLIMGGG